MQKKGRLGQEYHVRITTAKLAKLVNSQSQAWIASQRLVGRSKYQSLDRVAAEILVGLVSLNHVSPVPERLVVLEAGRITMKGQLVE